MKKQLLSLDKFSQVSSLKIFTNFPLIFVNGWSEKFSRGFIFANGRIV